MKFTKTLIATALLASFAGSTLAKMTGDEAARLGKDLTPVGGEMAARAIQG